MRSLAFFVGGVIGVLLVRALFMDPIEVIGWGLFWSGLADGRMMNMEAVFGSTTFLKCVAGFILGGGLSFIAVSKIKKPVTSPMPIDKESKTDTVTENNTGVNDKPNDD